MEEEEDTREVELSTIAAIFPEELKIDDHDPFTFNIELAVSLSKPLVVKFPALSESTPAVHLPGSTTQAVNEVDSQELSNLPSLQLRISLPEGYPREKPPSVRISTVPPWLSEEIITRLEGDASRLWEEIGRDQVVFTYIDDVQQSAEMVFGLVNEDNTLEVGPEHKIAILDYDIEAKRKAFEKGSFDCGICLGNVAFLSLGYTVIVTNKPYRSEERLRLSSDDRLRPRFLYPMLAGLLQQRHNGGRCCFRQVPGAELRRQAGEGSTASHVK